MSFCRYPLLDIFYRLLKFFGPQYWWPARDKFEVIIGAVLAQNVNWKNVEKAILNLERADLLDPDKILEAEEDVLIEVLKPARYPAVKSKRLKNLLLFFKKRDFNFDWYNFLGIEEFRRQLLEINGVGMETADSILLYGFNRKIFVVDAYTKRIFERHSETKLTKNNWYEELRTYFEGGLPENVNVYNEFHALLVLLGNSYCKKNPACEFCPLRGKKI